MSKKTTADNVRELHPKKPKVNLLSDVPAIRKYLDRIGAEARSLRTARIATDAGRYRHDIASIKLQPDGTWYVSRPSLAPTDEEREEIVKQLGDFEWPQLWKLPKPPPCPQVEAARKANRMNVFEFRDTAGNLVMYQVRVDEDDGNKTYVPWTYWDDDQWRQCEPDGPLPLWGLEQLKHHSVVFLHEGAKGARAARKIASLQAERSRDNLDDLDAEERDRLLQHPWLQELSHAAHIGWIGGAPNPHRTDWSPLKGTYRVFIVADNDTEGVDAIPMVSKELSQWGIVEVYSISFDTHFPLSFDLADDFFARANEGKLWDRRADGTKRYIGPAFRELLKPATWAVKELPPKPDAEKKRGPKVPTFVLRKEFRDQWVLTTELKPNLFINRWDPSRQYEEADFNKVNRPFSGPVKALSALMQKEASVAIDTISYEPGREKGEKGGLVIRGRRTINTWTPTLIQPVTGQHYDPQSWLDFLAHLFPVESEREDVKKFCATLIARPRNRIKFALLLASVMQGVGKTTLTDILRCLVGEHNSSIVKEHDIESDFNDWLTHKRLVVAPEIYSGHSWKTYQNLKSLITDDIVRVNAKYMPQYEVSLWAVFIFCSNSRAPLAMEDTDRRYFMPTVTEERRAKEYWNKLRAWLNDRGFGIIRQWAEDYVSGHGEFGPADLAPETARKEQLKDDNRMRTHHLIRKLGTMMMDQPTMPVRVTREGDGKIVGGIVVLDEDVLEWLGTKMKRDEKLPSLATIRAELRQVGISISKKRVRIGGELAYACANFTLPDDVLGSHLTTTLPADIAKM